MLCSERKKPGNLGCWAFLFVWGVQVRAPKSVHTELADLDGRMDLVLIDAPCTGTGSWRRTGCEVAAAARRTDTDGFFVSVLAWA